VKVWFASQLCNQPARREERFGECELHLIGAVGRKTVLCVRKSVLAALTCDHDSTHTRVRSGGNGEWGETRPNLPGHLTKFGVFMRNLKQSVVAFLRDEEGLTVVEYAIAGGLVGLGVIVAFTDLGEEVARIINAIVAELQTVNP
jgi:pilus assembly protein Flp/PilA